MRRNQLRKLTRSAASLLLVICFAVLLRGEARNITGARRLNTNFRTNFAKRVGIYTTKTTLTYYPGESMTGTAQISSVLDGHFLREETYTETHGKHSELHYFGYDQGKGEYQAVWMDPMSSRVQLTTGRTGDGGKTVVYSGWTGMTCLGPSAVTIKIRQVDDDHTVYTYLAEKDGVAEQVFEETTYTRTK